MALSRRRAGAVSALSIVLLFALAGCGGPVTAEDAGSTPTATPSSSPSETADADDDGDVDDGGDDEGQADSDGGEDPAQDRVRTGPVAQYGGPAYGDQGVAEVIEPGLWCKTIAVFWGGDVPDGVRFTFEEAVTDRPGLQVAGGVCGTRGADRSCLGMTVAADESGIFCSLELRPSADFHDPTTITFTGTLECPTAEICDTVAARDVRPGPPIIVTDPGADGDQEGQDEQDQDQQDQDQQDQDQQDQDQEDQDQQQDEGDPGQQDDGSNG